MNVCVYEYMWYVYLGVPGESEVLDPERGIGEETAREPSLAKHKMARFTPLDTV